MGVLISKEVHTKKAICCDGASTVVETTQSKPNVGPGYSLLPTPEKLPIDKKLYRSIVLDNGMRVVLISDTESEDGNTEADGNDKENMTSAAALTVNVGSFSNPQELQGLAVFLEHIMFKGSEKFPDENMFDSFIKNNYGYSYINTDSERTNYELEVKKSSFKEALDIFAQFFISPLMEKESVDKALETVNEGFELWSTSERCRQLTLLGSLAKHGNPLSGFIWGNTESLKTIPESQGIDVHARVREFYEKHYSSHLMTLCLISQESLDTLQDWAVSIFSGVPKRDISAPTFEGHEKPFDTPDFYKLLKVCPVQELEEFALTWSLPSMIKHYKTSPLTFIEWLVEHEGPGSLCYYLRKRCWAERIGTTTSHYRISSLYSLEIYLTDAGFEHLGEIYLAIFQYLDMLKKNSTCLDKPFAELKNLSDTRVRFRDQVRFKDESSILNIVNNVCVNMQLCEPEDYITGDLSFHYDEDLIKQCLESLRHDNCNVRITSRHYQKGNPCDRTEKWMQISYSQEDIPDEWIEKVKGPPENLEFNFPEANPYIASDFEIKLIEEKYNQECPVKLKETNLTRLWFKKDLKFKTPEAFIYIDAKSPIYESNPQNSVLASMFLYQLKLNLSSEIYISTLASLKFDSITTEESICLSFSGFNHKLGVLLSKVLDYMVDFDLTEDMFDSLKSQFLKLYYEELLEPDVVCESLRFSILQPRNWTSLQKWIVTKSITIDTLKSFPQEFIANLFIEMMVHGNSTPNEALEYAEIVENKLNFNPILPGMISETRTMELPVGEKIARVMSFNPEDSTSSIWNYYQFGPGTMQTFTNMELLTHIMMIFVENRNPEEFQYNISGRRNTNGVIGFMVFVNSSAGEFSCSYVDERIEMFLNEIKDKFESLTEEEFEKNVSSIIKLKNHPDRTMSAECDYYWTEIRDSQPPIFDRFERQIEILKKLTLEEFKEFSADVLDKTKFRKLSCQVVGYGEKAMSECVPFNSKTNEIISQSNLALETETCNNLLYLRSVDKKKKKLFIDQVSTFKDSLFVYPVTKF